MGFVGYFIIRCFVFVIINFVVVEMINFISNYNKVFIDSFIEYKLGYVFINDGIDLLFFGRCIFGFCWKLVMEIIG